VAPQRRQIGLNSKVTIAAVSDDALVAWLSVEKGASENPREGEDDYAVGFSDADDDSQGAFLSCDVAFEELLSSSL